MEWGEQEEMKKMVEEVEEGKQSPDWFESDKLSEWGITPQNPWWK